MLVAVNVADLRTMQSRGKKSTIWPHGAGKATVINCLIGIMPVTEGDALIYGDSLRSSTGMSNVRRMIGVCPSLISCGMHYRLGNNRHLFSSIKGLPPTIKSASPSSSIDSFVSEGSSSTSTSIKPSNSVESLSSATSSSPSVVSIEQPCIKKDASSNRLQSQPTAKGSLGTRVLSEPSNKDHAIRSSTSSNTGAKNFKPSGLRMPSPKIGYFDAEKTQVSKSPNNFSKIGLSSSLVKGGSIGTNDNVGTNKPKFSRIPSLRPAAPQTTKPASPSQFYLCSQVSFQYCSDGPNSKC